MPHQLLVTIKKPLKDKDTITKEPQPIKEMEKDENNDDNNNVITGVAITGSVVGAAAAFVFLKKNPKQYAKLTKSFTSVKRGATKVTRKLTTKKNHNLQQYNSNTNNTNTVAPEYNGEYRSLFTESMRI